MTTPDLFMVIDVKAIGLHGEHFAVGYVVVDRARATLEEGLMACDPKTCTGTDEGRQWVAEHVPPMRYDYPTPQSIFAAFWPKWLAWKARGAVLVADCGWPVEARFLIFCIDWSHDAREMEGPYPLYDLASVLLARGEDALEAKPRMANELPAHHPLHDARQSARLLLDALLSSAYRVEVL